MFDGTCFLKLIKSALSDLRPTRVLLKTKQTKRCPTCRHIIVKPDPKATSNRFKIKLMALNYLPEIQIKPPVPLSTGQSNSNPATMEERRRSVLAGGSSSGSGGTLARRRLVAGSVSGLFGSSAAVNEDSLVPGRSYLYEAIFSNPLDDAMVVRLAIGRHSNDSERTNPKAEIEAQLPVSPSKQSSSSARPHWQVSPSTSTFPISAFNEAWELGEDDSELLDQATDREDRTRVGSSGGGAGGGDADYDVSTDNDGDFSDDREQKRSRTDMGGNKERRRKGDGILKRKGHETTIAFECVLGKEAKGEIQFPLQVTYTYSPEPDQEEDRTKRADSASGDKSSSKSFTFWTIVHLGRVSSLSSTDAQGGPGGAAGAAGPSQMTAEARRSALDKRRSMIGLGSAGGVSTLRKLSEKREQSVEEENGAPPSQEHQQDADESNVPRDKGNMSIALDG